MPEYKKYKDLAIKYCRLDSKATKKLKAGPPVVEGTAIVLAIPVTSETGYIHATLVVEDDDFSSEDKFGIAFVNLAADGAPEVPTKIHSINYDIVLKQSGGKVNPTWVLLDNQ